MRLSGLCSQSQKEKRGVVMRRVAMIAPIFFSSIFFSFAWKTATHDRVDSDIALCSKESCAGSFSARLHAIKRLRSFAQIALINIVTQRLHRDEVALRSAGKSRRRCIRARQELLRDLFTARDTIDWQAMESEIAERRRVCTGCPSGIFSFYGLVESMSSGVTQLQTVEGLIDGRGPVALIEPGAYRLHENLISSPGSTAAITITSPGVTLDLAGYTVSVSGQIGIDIQASNVTVKNGKIDGCSTGVRINKIVSGVNLRDLDIRDCTSYGVWFKGVTNGLIHTVQCNSTTSGDGIVVTTGGSSDAKNVEVTNSKVQFSSDDGFVFELSGSGGGPLVALNNVSFENDGDGFDVTQNASSGQVLLKGNSALRQSGTGDIGFRTTDAGPGIAVVNCYASENTTDYSITTTNNDFYEEATTTSGNWSFWECYSPGI